jgi:hypothetical protein
LMGLPLKGIGLPVQLCSTATLIAFPFARPTSMYHGSSGILSHQVGSDSGLGWVYSLFEELGGSQRHSDFGL